MVTSWWPFTLLFPFSFFKCFLKGGQWNILAVAGCGRQLALFSRHNHIEEITLRHSNFHQAAQPITALSLRVRRRRWSVSMSDRAGKVALNQVDPRQQSCDNA